MYLLEFMYLVFTHLPGYRKCSIHHITPNGQRKVLKPALAAMLSMGKHWKRVPTSTWAGTCGPPMLRTLDSGVPVKELMGVYPKSQVSDQHYSGMPHIGVCLGCLVSPQAQGHPTTWKRTMTSSQVHDQQLHRQICAGKSELVMSWTTKMIDLAGDAPQNQQWPCRHNPASFFCQGREHRWKSVTRGPDWDTVPKKWLLLLEHA